MLCHSADVFGAPGGYAAGSGPDATSFFRLGSTVRFKPSSVLAPSSSRSPFSAMTTSSLQRMKKIPMPLLLFLRIVFIFFRPLFRRSLPPTWPLDPEFIQPVLHRPKRQSQQPRRARDVPPGLFHRLNQQRAFELFKRDAFGRELESAGAFRLHTGADLDG